MNDQKQHTQVLPQTVTAAQANAILLATVLGLAGLFAVGAALSLFTGRNALWSGLRMVFIGGSAALTTYLIGKWLGVSLS